MYKMLMTTFMKKHFQLYDKNIPLTKNKIFGDGQKVPWITKGILKSRKNKKWKLINEVINKSKLNPELPDCFIGNETFLTDPTEIGNKFNEYFVNVGPNLAAKIPDSDVKRFNFFR